MKLTIAKLERFAVAIANAADDAEDIYRDSDEGKIDPEEASAALALVIERIQTAIVEVES
jgi:hypothetical protein